MTTYWFGRRESERGGWGASEGERERERGKSEIWGEREENERKVGEDKKWGES